MAPILPKSLSTPSPIHTYSTTEAIIYNSYSQIHKESQKRSSKCLVYILASFVTFLAIWVVFSSIVLHVKDPNLELRSARVLHISYNTSPSLSFNITMVATMKIMNPNFGYFIYGNGSVSVVHGATNIGGWEISGAKMEARESKEFSVMVNMRYSKILLVSENNITNEIHSGMLKLRSYAKLSGTIYLLKIVKKMKTIEMNCVMNLNLTSQSFHYIQC
ncbi:PREDICTED: late embryogenesis abundant protein At1g64065 [Lupinus angustifolius]|uniref:late embryogenesis abundant protein At1g64065 n=1 Tax=Lupinus angustifolius TaxID=3871 RepID=UPI00092E9AA6|nr:PREDICTED: late embryogenesis abundant protein At1g64065 [Lupinus angustifolius]